MNAIIGILLVLSTVSYIWNLIKTLWVTDKEELENARFQALISLGGIIVLLESGQ